MTTLVIIFIGMAIGCIYMICKPYIDNKKFRK